MKYTEIIPIIGIITLVVGAVRNDLILLFTGFSTIFINHTAIIDDNKRRIDKIETQLSYENRLNAIERKLDIENRKK